MSTVPWPSMRVSNERLRTTSSRPGLLRSRLGAVASLLAKTVPLPVPRWTGRGEPPGHPSSAPPAGQLDIAVRLFLSAETHRLRVRCVCRANAARAHHEDASTGGPSRSTALIAARPFRRRTTDAFLLRDGMWRKHHGSDKLVRSVHTRWPRDPHRAAHSILRGTARVADRRPRPPRSGAAGAAGRRRAIVGQRKAELLLHSVRHGAVRRLTHVRATSLPRIRAAHRSDGDSGRTRFRRRAAGQALGRSTATASRFLIGLLLFVVLFVVYATSLKTAELSVVTMGWVVLLQVGLILVDRFRYDVAISRPESGSRSSPSCCCRPI